MNDLLYYRRLVDDHLNRVKEALYHGGHRELAPNEFRISSVGCGHRELWYMKHPDHPDTPKRIEEEFNPQEGSPVIPGTVAHEVFQTKDPYMAPIYEETTVEYIHDYADYALDGSGELDQFFLTLTGHVDNDRLHPDLIVDYKTLYEEKTRAYRPPRDGFYYLDSDHPKQSHQEQVNTYACILKRPYYVIVYIGKNTWKHEIRIEKTNYYLFNLILKKLERALTEASPETLPDDCEAWKCQFCAYRPTMDKPGGCPIAKSSSYIKQKRTEEKRKGGK